MGFLDRLKQAAVRALQAPPVIPPVREVPYLLSSVPTEDAVEVRAPAPSATTVIDEAALNRTREMIRLEQELAELRARNSATPTTTSAVIAAPTAPVANRPLTLRDAVRDLLAQPAPFKPFPLPPRPIISDPDQFDKVMGEYKTQVNALVAANGGLFGTMRNSDLAQYGRSATGQPGEFEELLARGLRQLLNPAFLARVTSYDSNSNLFRAVTQLPDIRLTRFGHVPRAGVRSEQVRDLQDPPDLAEMNAVLEPRGWFYYVVYVIQMPITAGFIPVAADAASYADISELTRQSLFRGCTLMHQHPEWSPEQQMPFLQTWTHAPRVN